MPADPVRPDPATRAESEVAVDVLSAHAQHLRDLAAVEGNPLMVLTLQDAARRAELTGPPAGHNHYIEGTGTWAAEVARLTAALKVCEEALHSTAVIRANPDERLIHAAQQASGAYMTSWAPGQQERDDAGGTDG